LQLLASSSFPPTSCALNAACDSAASSEPVGFLIVFFDLEGVSDCGSPLFFSRFRFFAGFDVSVPP
jgi:hypothetical protein